MTYVIEVNDDSNFVEILEKVRESIMSSDIKVGYSSSDVTKIKDQPLDQGLMDTMTFTLTGKEQEKIDPEYTEFEDILKETISNALLKKAIQEFEIVKNYIKAFDSNDIRWEEKVDIDFDDGSYLDQFKTMVLDLISEKLKKLNLMDYDILNQMENIILPIISEKLLSLISDFKEEYRRYDDYNEQVIKEEKIRAEQESMKANSNRKYIEIYIVIKKDNIILTRNKSGCICLGLFRDTTSDWAQNLYCTQYNGETYLFKESDYYDNIQDAAEALANNMGWVRDNSNYSTYTSL